MLKIKIIVRGMVLMAIVVLCLAPWNRTAGQNDKVNSGVFEWVRSYYGPEYPDGAAANEILGSVVDGEGNIYILGQIVGNARWDDGRSVMPIAAHRNRMGVVAKLDRRGERVWQGELYSSYGDFDVYGMRRVGDTAVMLFVEFRYPFEWGNTKNEVYYWDTLLTTRERFPEEADSMESPRGYYAFITIGMGSGKIIEEHFWIPTFVREDGRLLREEGGGGLMTNVGERVAFNVDSEGNIVLARQANDCFGDRCDSCRDGIYQWSTQEGNIVGMRLLVDGGTKELDVPLEPSSRWNWQIVKLSPHMDRVIASTYVFDSTWRYGEDNVNVNLNLNLNANFNLNLNVNLNANWPDGMGLMVWDYDGKELYHHNVNVNLNANWPDGMGLTGTLTADAELGDHNIYAGWNSHAYVARYTDTAFMTPYIYTDPHVGLNEHTTQRRCRIYPNPTRGTLHIITNDEKIRSVSAVSALGQPISIRPAGEHRPSRRLSLGSVHTYSYHQYEYVSTKNH